jgi:hypothetical protein
VRHFGYSKDVPLASRETGRGAESTIAIASVPDAEDDDSCVLRPKLVDDPIVAEAERTKAGELSLQGFAGQWVCCDRGECRFEAGNVLGGEAFFVSASRCGELEAGRHLPTPLAQGLAEHLLVRVELSPAGLLPGLSQAAGEGTVAQDL